MPGRVRIGAAWLLVPPFLVLARPTPPLLTVGFLVAVVGLAIRAWAAGWLDKQADLATGGPYAYTRNPLYLGSFVIGIGMTLAGGHWLWPIVFAGFFLFVYVPTMRREAAELGDRFGDRYRAYRAGVPAFALRLTPYRPTTGRAPTRSEGPGLAWRRYLRYREWEAALGTAGVFGVLAAKWWLVLGGGP